MSSETPKSGPGWTELAAAYAQNARPHGRMAAHLVVGDDATRSLCGVLRGEPAPRVTCKSCLYRWAHDTPEGRRVAGEAADRAVREHVDRKVVAHPAMVKAAVLDDMFYNLGAQAMTTQAMTTTPDGEGHDNPEVPR